MQLVQSSPIEIRELNLNNFRLALKDWEDDLGITFPKTHNHNTTVSISGVQLARVIEILDPYTITFENGAYAVNLVGANSNIADRLNLNTVSVRAANSAGLIQTREIEYASFNGAVTIDTVNGTDSTAYPYGTPAEPCKTLANAAFIANLRGFNTILLVSNLTITATDNVDNFKIVGDVWNREVTIESGASLENTEFEKVSLYGVMGGGWNVLTDCWIYNITNFCGWIRGGSIENVSVVLGYIGGEYSGQSYMDNLLPMYPGISSEITMGATTSVSFTLCTDIVTIKSLTSSSEIICGLLGGDLIIDSSCTGGNVVVTGVGDITNNSTLDINMNGLVRGEEVQYAGFKEGITIDVLNGQAGTNYPVGTSAFPVNNIPDALVIAQARGFSILYVKGNVTLSSIDFPSYDGATIIGQGPKNSTITISGVIFTKSNFQDCSLTGTFGNGSAIHATHCLIEDLYNISIDVHDSILMGTIELNDSISSNFIDCIDGVPGSGAPIIEVNDCESVGIWDYSGGIKLTNMTTPGTSVSFNAPSGRLIVDSTDTQGSIIARGVGSISGTTGGTTITQTDLLNRDTIADTTWDEATSAHQTAGSTGKAITDAGAAGNPWSSMASSNNDPGTMGELMNKIKKWTGWLRSLL